MAFLPFNVFGFITVIALMVVFLIFAMKYATAMVQARVQAAADSSYRDLAAQALSVQEANAALLSEMAARLASLEKLLKDVG
jgi:signal transduction histidine kinase